MWFGWSRELWAAAANTVNRQRSTFKAWFIYRPVDKETWLKESISVVLLYIFFALLWYWNLHVPSPGKSVAVLAIVAAIMAVVGEMKGKEKIAWILLLFGFLHVELNSIDKERAAAETIRSIAVAQETKQFSDIGAGIKQAIQEGSEHFKAEKLTLAQLLAKNDQLVRGLPETMLINMSPKELAAKSHDVAEQMSSYSRNYLYQDQLISERYSDRLEGSRSSSMTDKDKQDWKNDEKKKHEELRIKYEEGARTIISIANRLRLEMLKKLVNIKPNPVDKSRASWFENPVPDKTGSFLLKLDDNAKYLEGLAGRVMNNFD
jgi:hypothetical protein